ncbi:hypothetical protein PPACK8108_LOCUS16336 [Phakopsora pachyrhizi]|uniref:Uncharacterized protein n=1 Tax=Phakopsora pachyrhizi TaxID=170000 RepID=A0AAV0B953_PHAPC|nr:hypothetical protein PPACK8108_LOCUS16336 [Phakopsora pachyrhizi]
MIDEGELITPPVNRTTREADFAVVEDVDKIRLEKHRKQSKALRGNKEMATEENLIKMMDNEEPGRAANSQSQDWLLDKVDPQFVNLKNDSLRWSFGSPPTRKEDFNKDKQAYRLGTQLNDEMGKTFCSLSGWFESLEVGYYEPFDLGDSKGKRKADCSLE